MRTFAQQTAYVIKNPLVFACRVVAAFRANQGLLLAGAVAYYTLLSVVPLLILIGDKDDWTLAANCRKLQAAGFARPELVDVVYYPTAYHSFDSRVLDRTITVADGKSHHLAYDPAAAPDAEARTRAFFDKYLNQR